MFWWLWWPECKQRKENRPEEKQKNEPCAQREAECRAYQMLPQLPWKREGESHTWLLTPPGNLAELRDGFNLPNKFFLPNLVWVGFISCNEIISRTDSVKPNRTSVWLSICDIWVWVTSEKLCVTSAWVCLCNSLSVCNIQAFVTSSESVCVRSKSVYVALE